MTTKIDYNIAIPADLQSTILSYLPKEEIPNTFVNKAHTNSGINKIIQDETNTIVQFTTQIYNTLVREDQQVLFNNQNFVQNQDLTSVRAIEQHKPLIKQHKQQLQTELVNGLKMLDDPTLIDLESKVPPPESISNIFRLTSLEKQIEKVNRMTDTLHRPDTLSTISVELTKAGYTNRAIEVAMSIPLPGPRWDALGRIIKTLLVISTIDHTINVALSPSYEEFKYGAILIIVKHLNSENNIDKALETAKFITDHQTYSVALSHIAVALAKTNEIEKAEKIAQSIPDKICKNNTLKLIAKKKTDDDENFLPRKKPRKLFI